jgi:hypothetical protein
MNGYVCFYEKKRIEVHAETLYAATLKAKEQFKPPKSKQHMVHCVLAEKDGVQVVHRPTF